MSNQEIAEAYSSALRNCTGLRVAFATSDGHTAVAGWSMMAPGDVKTVVWIAAPNARPQCAMSSKDGRVIEIRPIKYCDKFKTIAYDAADESGTAHSPDDEPIDCLWGMNCESWIGPHSDEAHLFGDRLSKGQRESDQTVADRPCYVIQWRMTAENGLVVSQRFYIDRRTFMLLRFDSAQTFQGETISRVRHNRFRLTAVDQLDWGLSATEFDQTRLHEVLEEIGVEASPGLELIASMPLVK